MQLVCHEPQDARQPVIPPRSLAILRVILAIQAVSQISLCPEMMHLGNKWAVLRIIFNPVAANSAFASVCRSGLPALKARLAIDPEKVVDQDRQALQRNTQLLVTKQLSLTLKPAIAVIKAASCLPTAAWRISPFRSLSKKGLAPYELLKSPQEHIYSKVPVPLFQQAVSYARSRSCSVCVFANQPRYYC